MVDQTLREHEHMIDEHDIRLETLQSDVDFIKSELNDLKNNVNDVKVRLGIKDKTNGQVVEYQEQLVEAQKLERSERKEADNQLREDIKKVDDKVWYVLGAVILMILFEIFKIQIGGG